MLRWTRQEPPLSRQLPSVSLLIMSKRSSCPTESRRFGGVVIVFCIAKLTGSLDSMVLG